MPNPTDTIVAVSSPPGRSSRGLIRISGPDVKDVLKRILVQPHAKTRELAAVRLRIHDLPALLLRFEAPASYTGDDLAELQLPGNAALLDKVLHQMIQGGEGVVRLAEPGEFTFRAYTAGKLDLTQAEGVGATISAVSDSQLAAASLLRQGKLGHTAETLVNQLGNLLALVEAGIDFTDQEDVTPIAPDTLADHISALALQLEQLLARSRSWGAIESLPRVVLVGPPSAGKSTLFNALLGKERAVIDPTPGTTRDALSEPLQLQDSDGRVVEVMLVDLAGLDHELDSDTLLPDRHAQEVVHETIKQADLLLRLSDNPSQWMPLDADLPKIDVLSKWDSREDAKHGTSVRVNAHTGFGMDTLRREIVNTLAGQAVSIRADLLALQPRHEQAIKDAAQSLQQTKQLIDGSSGDRLPDIELLAGAMRSALDALASLGGRLTPDEVIGRVFATFCVGK